MVATGRVMRWWGQMVQRALQALVVSILTTAGKPPAAKSYTPPTTRHAAREERSWIIDIGGPSVEVGRDSIVPGRAPSYPVGADESMSSLA